MRRYPVIYWFVFLLVVFSKIVVSEAGEYLIIDIPALLCTAAVHQPGDNKLAYLANSGQ